MKRVAAKIVKVDRELSLSAQLFEAAQIIKSGGLVVFPTETVYGLGADGINADAAKKIYEAKGRPSDNPLIIHVFSPDEAEKYVYTPTEYYRLAAAFMPGPLTVVLKAKDIVPMATRGGLSTVAIRCPENEIARKLIELSGTAIAAPSANISGSPSPTRFSHVYNDMADRVDMIIDGGECEIGLESTIVSIDDDGFLTLLRPGGITVSDIESIGLSIKVADAVVGELKDGEVALSPGMKYRHYAPKAPLVLLEGDKEEIISYIAKQQDGKVCVISYDEDVEFYSNNLIDSVVLNFGEKLNEQEQAKRLFNLLRDADAGDFNVIYAPLPSRDGIGLALYNRMIRAAAHKIINLRR